MKFFVASLLFCFSFSVNASDNDMIIEAQKGDVVLNHDVNDRGRKNHQKSRKKKRINKKRKRKCSQFGRKIYAG